VEARGFRPEEYDLLEAAVRTAASRKPLHASGLLAGPSVPAPRRAGHSLRRQTPDHHATTYTTPLRRAVGDRGQWNPRTLDAGPARTESLS